MVEPTILEPLANSVSHLMSILQILVGGLFGLYVIEFVYKILTFRKTRKQLRQILAEINDVKQRLSRIERRSQKTKNY